MKKTLLAVATALMATTAVHAAGELNIYNWGNYTSPEMIKKFEKENDVKVTITDYDSNDTALAKVRQGGHGFDIVIPSQSHIPIWISEGLIQEARPDQMPNFKNVKEDLKNPEFDPGRHYTVPWAMGTVGVVVNTKAYQGPIDSWGIIFNPPEELKGKINVVPEMGDVMDAAILYNGGKKCTGDLEVLKKARDTLVNAKPSWISMEYGTIEKMGAGDIMASSDWNGSALRQRLKDPNVKFGYPKEGFVLWSDNIAILKDAKNVDNAKAFMNFMMDPQNAGMNSGFHRYANGIQGSDAFMPDDMKGAPELDVPESLKHLAVPSQTCPPEVLDLYTKIWTELQK